MDISCADQVYNHVRAGILNRSIADNELLGEGQLAEQVGVSRTPVREALLRLEAEGMIRLLPKRGALVLPITANDCRDLLEARELVETHCVAKVIDRGRALAVSDGLDAAMEHLRAAAAAGDVPAYVHADREFHAAIVTAAGNEILTRLYASLRDRQLRMGATNLLADAGRPDVVRIEETVTEHAGIAEAIRAEDVELALTRVRAHLATAERHLRE